MSNLERYIGCDDDTRFSAETYHNDERLFLSTTIRELVLFEHVANIDIHIHIYIYIYTFFSLL